MECPKFENVPDADLDSSEGIINASEREESNNSSELPPAGTIYSRQR